MPKAKPTQVIVHRIELQETERATLEAALAGRFVTNGVSAIGSVFSGLGAALAPFSGVLTALGALWIADRTLGEIQEIAEKAIETATDYIFPQMKTAQDMYMFIPGWLSSHNNHWGKMCSKSYEVDDYLREHKAYYFLFLRWKDFIAAMKTRYQAGGKDRVELERLDMAKHWISFYPTNSYLNDIKSNT